MTAPAANPLLTAALGYAARGWRVFPAHPKTKEALNPRDKDAEGNWIPKSGGIVKATTDVDQITAWWTKWPKAIVVAAMGPDAGVFALDFDPRHDEDTGEVWTVPELIAAVEAQIGVPLPPTATALSPSGGEHWYYRWPAGGPAITGRAVLPKHVDVRGLGGGCNLPPSVRADGAAYSWQRGLEHLADAPAELLAVLQRPKPPALVPRVAVDLGPLDEAVVEAVRKYVMAGLDRECRLVETVGSGTRNPQLNKSAFAVAGLVAATLSTGATLLSAPMARAALLDAAKANPGRDDLAQIEATLDSGWTSGLANPRDLSEVEANARERHARTSGMQRGSAGHAGARLSPRGDAAAAPPADAPASPPADAPASLPAPASPVDCSKKSSHMGGSREPPQHRGAGECDDAGIMRPQTDLGNAERWLMRHGVDFRYCPTLGWLAWDQRRWSRDDADMLLSESVYATVRSIGDEADACAAAGGRWREVEGNNDFGDAAAANPDPWVDMPKTGKWKRRSDRHAMFGRTSESERAIRAIVKLIVPFVTIRQVAFDADPMLLNVANGTLRFWTETPYDTPVGMVELRPHDPADLITMLAEVEYDPAATSPVYDAFLERVQPDPALRDFLHAWGGYSLTGDVSEQKFVINQGAKGSNGKSTWINALAHVMGDYAISVPIEVFLDSGRTRNAGAPSPDLAELPRRRMVRTSEPPQGVPFAESLLKLATGGEVIRARHLNLPFFEYQPEFKITVSMNPAPKLSDDAATWRRIRIVPWYVIVTGSNIDKELPDKLKGEASGILNRMIAGLLRWLEQGLPQVDAIDDATAAQRAAADPLSQFLALATVEKPKARAGTTEFHKVFVAWAEWAGATTKPWSQPYLAKAMALKGFDKIQSNTMWFVGLELTKSVDDFLNPVTGKPWTVIGGDEGPVRRDEPDDPGPEPPEWEDRGRRAGG